MGDERLICANGDPGLATDAITNQRHSLKVGHAKNGSPE